MKNETITINCKQCHNYIDSMNELDCPHCHANNRELSKSLVGKYLVSEWGYSMSLTTWVKVISETQKTLLVKEVKSRNTTTEEDAKYGLTYGWLQNYVLPTDKVETRNGEEQKAFRVYKRSTRTDTIITPEGSKQQIIDIYVGRTPGSSMKHYFELWDGKPIFENHCD